MALPDIQFTAGDARVLQQRLKEFYEAVRRATLEPDYHMGDADPMRLVQMSEAAILAQVNTDIDLTGKGNLLRYAGETTIGDIGYLYGKRGDRLQPSFASATIRYNLSTVRNVATFIPARSKVTPDNRIFFETVEPLSIPAGELFGDVKVKCLTVGYVGNGFDVGIINNIVDRVPFVESAENITVSSGGADLEDLEAYRARIREVPESFSTAGPDGAYRFWAMSANAGIIDVAVWMPPLDTQFFKLLLAEILTSFGVSAEVTDAEAEHWQKRFDELCFESGTGPGNVNIAPLMAGGQLPTDEIMQAVYEAVSPKDRRPLTDWVHTVLPTTSDYTIDFEYWIRTDDAADASNIQAGVNQAVADYITWQSEKLGRDINPSELIRRVMQAGVKRVNLRQPVFTRLQPAEVAKLISEPIIDYGGFEDD